MNEKQARQVHRNLYGYKLRLAQAVTHARVMMTQTRRSAEHCIVGAANKYHIHPDVIAHHVWPKVG